MLRSRFAPCRTLALSEVLNCDGLHNESCLISLVGTCLFDFISAGDFFYVLLPPDHGASTTYFDSRGRNPTSLAYMYVCMVLIGLTVMPVC